MSAPAENAFLPVPVMMIALTSSSASHVVSASSTSAISGMLSAFSTCGRLSVMTATPSARSNSMCSNGIRLPRRRSRRQRVHHDRFVHRRRVHLEDLDVVGAVELVVHDPRGLHDAVAGVERVLALSV